MSRISIALCTIVATSMSALAALPAPPDATGAPPSEMSPEQMMEMWMSANAKGEHHEHLARFKGNWDAEVQMFMQPGADAEISKGSQRNYMMLDGRYLASEFEGEFMGMPFKGHGLMGYDGVKKQYVSLWVDSTSTGFFTTAGQGSDDKKTMTLTGEMEMPGMGTVKSRQVWTFINPDKYTYESFELMPGMEDHRSMLITYSRKRDASSTTDPAGTGARPTR